jgi:Tol biopolymer transport system component
MAMSSERWDEVEKQFHEAMQLPPREQAKFVEQIPDLEVRREVASLLVVHSAGESPSVGAVVADAAREVVDRSLTGQVFDHFQIVQPIGHGGMGDVYLSQDLKLGRQVALKLLPRDFQKDTERLRFFEREARAAAALNHPNVMAVYEAGQYDGRSYIAAEYVEGETLTDCLYRGRLHQEEALRLAGQIAAALGAAHEKGIIHRDLKPSNIKIRPDGVVKVLDFGLAKLTERLVGGARGESPPNLSRTQTGVILGTAAYMSPEQARGASVDKRADIWSFGVVLYEMLTGESPFERKSLADTLAAVIKEEPDFNGVPARFRGALARCLSKDPQKRWHDIGDVLFVLEDGSREREEGRPSRVASGARWIIASVACIAAVTASIGLLRAPHKAALPLIRLKVDLGPEARLVNDRGRHTLAISPDGARIAFSCAAPDGDLRMCTRGLSESQATALPGTEGVEKIFFSPDGEWVGFGARGKLKKVSVHGGAPIALADAPFDRGASWGEDGSIVAALIEHSGLLRVPENGGPAQPVTNLKPGENSHRWPQVLPGATAVLFTAGSQPGNYENANIDVVSFKTGQRKTLEKGGYYGRYLPGGYLTYMHQGTLFAARMDLDKLILTGPPTPVLADVDSRPGDGAAAFDCSRSGMFVYLSGGATSRSTVQWLDRSGKLEPIISVPGSYKQIRLSPEGKRLALVKEANANPDLWVYDIPRGALTRVTYGGANEEPVWAPDGRFLAYHSGRGFGVWWMRADGSGQPRRILEAEYIQSVTSFSHTHVALEELSPEVDPDIWTAPIEGLGADNPAVGKPELFLRTPAIESNPAFSPDGLWMAYTSDESGASQVYVRPFRSGVSQSGSKTLISTDGGSCPIWSPNGRDLFYTSIDRRIMVVVYHTNGGAFLPDRPVVWSSFQVEPPDRTPSFTTRSSIDIAPDGKRFAVLVPAKTESKAQAQVNVLLNWFDELERKSGKNSR